MHQVRLAPGRAPTDVSRPGQIAGMFPTCQTFPCYPPDGGSAAMAKFLLGDGHAYYNYRVGSCNGVLDDIHGCPAGTEDHRPPRQRG